MFLSLLTSCGSLSKFRGLSQIHFSVQLWLTPPSGSRLWVQPLWPEMRALSQMVHCPGNPDCSILFVLPQKRVDMFRRKREILCVHPSEIHFCQASFQVLGIQWQIEHALCPQVTQKLVRKKTHTQIDAIKQAVLWRRHCRIQQSQCKKI